MTCPDARNIILSADPAALRNGTDPVLRRHLEECAECAAAASHVVSDVARLRAALIARGARARSTRPRRSPARRVAMTLVPVALAAELAAFAFLGTRDNPNPLADRRPVIDDTVVSVLPAAHRIEPGEVSITPKPVHAKAAKRVAAANDTAPATTVDTTQRPAAPSEFMSAVEMGQLRVVPASSRERVAVLGTSNPKITVVLVSRVDSI